jgi:polyhydroxybutyrate depolymerase
VGRCVRASISIQWQGVDRFYHVRKPAKYVTGNGAVFVLHGGGGDVEKAIDSSAMTAEANTYGFLAVFPESGGSQWNDGRSTVDTTKDDIGYIDAVADDLVSRFGASRAKMALSGVSNGGMMTHRIASQEPTMFPVYATVIANMAEDIASPAPIAAVPMMMFNGVEDPLMPWLGGTIPGPVGGDVISTMATVALWQTANGTTGETETQMPDIAADDCLTYRHVYTGGTKPLTLYRTEGGGHVWPGSTQEATGFTGPRTDDISATKLMVEFFRQQGV